MRTATGDEFLISRGGPYYELNRRLSLARDYADNAPRRALVLVALTAMVPLLIALITQGPKGMMALALLPDFIARFVLFIVITVMAERSLERRLEQLLERFANSGLLTAPQLEKGAGLVSRALRLRNSALVEATCLALALLLAFLPIFNAEPPPAGEQALFAPGEGRGLSAAEWWVLLISGPIFWFLVLRWFWRILLWNQLLFGIARLDLRLVATHPDKSGGVAFIGSCPNAFSPIVAAFSLVLAAIVLRHVSSDQLSVEAYGFLMSAWLAIILVVFLWPLTAFVPPIARLKELTLTRADAIDTAIHRKKEIATLGQNAVGEDAAADEASEKELADPGAFRKAANELRLRPFSRDAVLPLSIAAVGPLLLAGMTLLPIKELFAVVKGILLL